MDFARSQGVQMVPRGPNGKPDTNRSWLAPIWTTRAPSTCHTVYSKLSKITDPGSAGSEQWFKYWKYGNWVNSEKWLVLSGATWGCLISPKHIRVTYFFGSLTFRPKSTEELDAGLQSAALFWDVFYYVKPPCFMGKSTISMAIFHSYVGLPSNSSLGKTLPCLPSPSHHHFYRCYKLTIPQITPQRQDVNAPESHRPTGKSASVPSLPPSPMKKSMATC